MPEPTMSIAADPADDLPRTLKRERAARERAAREHELAANREPSFSPRERDPDPRPFQAPAAGGWAAAGTDVMPASVRTFDVPFLHLVFFFLKASVAAIPALLVIGGLIIGAGKLLQVVAPQYRVAAVTIHLPWAGDMAPPRTAEVAKPGPAAPALVKK
jgi:hypothetical protein